MRRLSVPLIAAVSTIALTRMVLAADLPVKPVYKAPAVAPYSWTGFYVGGNVGYSWGNTDSTVSAPNLAILGITGFSDSLSPDGIIGGGQIGYNWQANANWVLGIEADIQASGQKDSDSFSDPFNFIQRITGTVSFSHEEKLTWFGTVRGRVGYIFWNNAMLYGTGGLAYGHVDSSLTATVSSNIVNASANFSGSDTKVGWTVGAGIEGPLGNSQKWTWKVEYLYLDLGSVDYSFNGGPTIGPVTFSTDVTDNIVRGGINYRF